MEYCQSYSNELEEINKIIHPIALRAALLVKLLEKIKNLWKIYEFRLDVVENIFRQFDEKVSQFRKVVSLFP